MAEAIHEIFKNIFGTNVWLATILISMIPIIELRGGIPFGMDKSLWGDVALSSWKSFSFSFLGSCLVVPFLALLFLPIINWLKKTKLFKNLATSIENMIKKKSTKIEADANKNLENVNEEKPKKFNKQYFIKIFGVFLFVAIPLPLTGVWTGTAIAVLLNFNFIETCITVILGNFVAGIIMMTICSIFPNFTNIILIVFLALALIFIIFAIIKNKINKNKLNKENK